MLQATIHYFRWMFIYNEYRDFLHTSEKLVFWYHVGNYLYSSWFIYHMIIMIYHVHNTIHMKHAQYMNRLYTHLHISHTCTPFTLPFDEWVSSINIHIPFTLPFLWRMDTTHTIRHITHILLPSISEYKVLLHYSPPPMTLPIHHPHTQIQFTSVYV